MVGPVEGGPVFICFHRVWRHGVLPRKGCRCANGRAEEKAGRTQVKRSRIQEGRESAYGGDKRAAEQSLAARHMACNSSRGWRRSPAETWASRAAKQTTDGVGRPLDTGETHHRKRKGVEVRYLVRRRVEVLRTKYRFYSTPLILTALTE